mgnify:CR=1 FL=1
MPIRSRKKIYKGGSANESTTARATRTLRGILTSAASSLKSKRVTNTECNNQITALKNNFRQINKEYAKIRSLRGISQEQKDKMNDFIFGLVLRLRCLVLRFILLKMEKSEGADLHEYLSIMETIKKQFNKVDVEIDLRLIGDCMKFYDQFDLSTREARKSQRDKDIVGKRAFTNELKKIFKLSDKEITDLKSKPFSEYIGCQLDKVNTFKIDRQTYTLSTLESAKRLPSAPSHSVFSASASEVSTAGKKKRKKPRSRSKRRKQSSK